MIKLLTSMAHKRDVYTQLQSKGIDHLRRVYDSANSASSQEQPRPSTRELPSYSKISFQERTPEKYLAANAFAEPHRIVVGADTEEHHAAVIMARIKDRLKDEIRRDLLNPSSSAHM